MSIFPTPLQNEIFVPESTHSNSMQNKTKRKPKPKENQTNKTKPFNWPIQDVPSQK